MGDPEEIDVEQIMDRIRENMRSKRGLTGNGSATLGRTESNRTRASYPADRAQSQSFPSGGGIRPQQVNGQITADLTALRSGYDIYHVHLTSHRKLVGSFIVFVKKLLQTLLTPFFERQVAYNATNVRVATSLKGQIDAFGQQLAQFVQVVEDRLTESHNQQQQFQNQQQEFQAARAQEFQALRGELEGRLAQIREPLHAAERKLRRIFYLLEDGQEVGAGSVPPHQVEKPSPPVVPGRSLHQVLAPDFDYFAFEDRFRGSEADIKERQRIYVEYYQGNEDVLDIGCGRGEFLELLKEVGVRAKGVDLDLDMVLSCREKGLDVVREDAFAYVEALPDDTLGGVFAAQVIEHLEPSRVIQLINLCHRKLRQGGILILETLNPKCLTIFAESFYMDLSHTRPIHPEAMRFLLESTGFEGVQVKFSAPVESSVRVPVLTDAGSPRTTIEEFNRGIERLNDLLYGFQDYAVIGKKSARL